MRAFATLLVLLAAAASGQTPGDCDLGQATAVLDASDVQATVYVTGSLFYGDGGQGEYRVPQTMGLA